MYDCFVKSFICFYLQRVFAGLNIVANHRHVWWACEQNPLSIAQNAGFYLIKHNVIMVWLQSIDKFMAQLVNSRLSDWQLQWL